jgi:Skp family chaperone for outer membrane proteins
VLAETPAFAGVRETMEREFAPLRDELQRLETALQTADEQFRAQGGTLTEAARSSGSRRCSSSSRSTSSVRSRSSSRSPRASRSWWRR